MASVVEKARIAAKKAIARVPESATFKVETAETYDPSTGKTALSTVNSIVDVSYPVFYSQFYVDGDVIRKEDQMVMLSAIDAENVVPSIDPKIGMKVTIASVEWTITNVKRHPGGSIVAAYELQLRK